MCGSPIQPLAFQDAKVPLEPSRLVSRMQVLQLWSVGQYVHWLFVTSIKIHTTKKDRSTNLNRIAERSLGLGLPIFMPTDLLFLGVASLRLHYFLATCFGKRIPIISSHALRAGNPGSMAGSPI